MVAPPPRWRRRKTARPSEIAAAALAVFAEKGFAGARLDDIANRAGVSKGALYLYFETKADIFRAVVSEAARPALAAIQAAAAPSDGPFAQQAPAILARTAEVLGSSRLPAVAKVVIGELRNFPDLARIWHDEVIAAALAALARLIARAQARGEIKPGDPTLCAFSMIAPLVLAGLFREVFAEAAAELPDLQALAAQHAQLVVNGMVIAAVGPP